MGQADARSRNATGQTDDDRKVGIPMNAAVVAAVVRHVLTAVAGGMVVKYGVDGATADAIIGGIAAAAGLGWSLLDKRKN